MTKTNLTYSKHLENDENYMKSVCKGWSELESEGNVSLYSYHDGVDWCHHHAIIVNNEVKHLLKDVAYYQAYLVYKAVVACLK